MKDSYKIKCSLKCIICGDTNFEYNDDKSWIKCKRCEKKYLGGCDELIELNQDVINQELEKTKKAMEEDLKTEMHDIIMKAFKK